MQATLTRPDAAFVARLREIFGERLSQAAAVREQHGRDEGWHKPQPPDMVVFAESTDEVARAVTLCAEQRVPVVPFGVGTSIEGHVAAVRGGVCIDLSRMNDIVAVNRDDMDATVQAGVTRKTLNAYLRDTGLFFPIDPGADATIGGMAATRASGTNAVRYGTMRENVLSLKAVMPDGRVIRTARRARKSSAGYDLTRLLVGSEGTLGIITEVTVRLHGIPEAISSAVCPFDDLEGAVRTVVQTIQAGVPVARVELLDETMMKAVADYAKLADKPIANTLFLEFHGSRAGVEEQAATVQALAEDNGGRGFAWATRQEERNALWQARHDALYAMLAVRPGTKAWTTDVCVPISRLAECIAETRRDIDGSRFGAARNGGQSLAGIVGHVGDGNFHVALLIDPDDAEQLAEAERINDRIVERALAMDGTCTGEHGVGIGKMRHLVDEHGEDGIAVMRAVKRALDPLGIMNPGKILGA